MTKSATPLPQVHDMHAPASKFSLPYVVIMLPTGGSVEISHAVGPGCHARVSCGPCICPSACSQFVALNNGIQLLPTYSSYTSTSYKWFQRIGLAARMRQRPNPTRSRGQLWKPSFMFHVFTFGFPTYPNLHFVTICHRITKTKLNLAHAQPCWGV